MYGCDLYIWVYGFVEGNIDEKTAVTYVDDMRLYMIWSFTSVYMAKLFHFTLVRRAIMVD